MKPTDFYMGVSEFLSILIPGFIVSIGIAVALKLICYKSIELNEWAVLLIISYMLSHILFAIGAIWDKLYDKFIPTGNDELLKRISRIREERAERDCGQINRYKWSRAVLTKIHPEGFAEVLRLESDSKLFRSMIVPFVVSAVVAIMEMTIWWSPVLLTLSFVCYWRYRDQRFKACSTAYTHVIVLDQLGQLDVKKT